MKRQLLTLGLAVIVMTSLSATRASIPSTEATELSGTVTDVNGSRIQAAGLEALGVDGRKFVTETSDDGVYAFLVPSGVYSLRAIRPGFCEARRGFILLADQKTLTFDFQLLTCEQVTPATRSADDLRPETPYVEVHPRYHYDELRPVAANGLRPLISYGTRENTESSTTYSGVKIDSRLFPVVYTYDLLSVKADEMVYSKDGSVHGAGHVVWQDQTNSENGTAIDITFPNGKPKVHLKR